MGRGNQSGEGPIVRDDAAGRLREAQATPGVAVRCVLICVVAQDYPWTETGRGGCGDHLTAADGLRSNHPG